VGRIDRKTLCVRRRRDVLNSAELHRLGGLEFLQLEKQGDSYQYGEEVREI
jgi:hypothetical protein